MTYVRTYRESMAEFSPDEDAGTVVPGAVRGGLVGAYQRPRILRRINKRIKEEQAKSVAEEVFPKLVELKGKMPVIRDQLPPSST